MKKISPRNLLKKRVKITETGLLVAGSEGDLWVPVFWQETYALASSRTDDGSVTDDGVSLVRTR